MLVGSDGLGLIEFDSYKLARTIGVVSLALILFEGGLTSGLLHLRPVLGAAVSLASVGTVLTALIVGLGASALFGLSTDEGLLLGAILSSTDGAAIFALLRGSTLSRKLGRTLEGESGLNDPVAVLLVLALIELLSKPRYGAADVLVLFVRELGIGLADRLAGRRGGRVCAAPGAARDRRPVSRGVPDRRRAGLRWGGHSARFRVSRGVSERADDRLGDDPGGADDRQLSSGLGLGGAGRDVPHAWVAGLPGPAPIGGVQGNRARAGARVLARPVAVAISTLPFAYTWPERAVLGWAGLRGAVPVVLATFPVIEHVPHSVQFFNIVFFAVLVSTVVQGSTFETFARRLRVTTNQPALPRPLSESGTIRRLGAEVLEHTVAASRRNRECARARPRLAARRARERHRSRRSGNPSPRLDPVTRGRRAAPADQRGVGTPHP